MIRLILLNSYYNLRAVIWIHIGVFPVLFAALSMCVFSGRIFSGYILTLKALKLCLRWQRVVNIRNTCTWERALTPALPRSVCRRCDQADRREGLPLIALAYLHHLCGVLRGHLPLYWPWTVSTVRTSSPSRHELCLSVFDPPAFGGKCMQMHELEKCSFWN